MLSRWSQTGVGQVQALVPAAIHLCPEAVNAGLSAKIRDGDILTLDAVSGQLTCSGRFTDQPPFAPNHLPQTGFGRASPH